MTLAHVAPAHCQAPGCGTPVPGPAPLYRSLVVCSIACEDAVDNMYDQRASHDPITLTIADWCSNLPRRLR